MHDAWFFIGIFIFIFLVWVATGGPLHPIAFTGPTLAAPDALGGGTYLQFPRSPYTTGSLDSSVPRAYNNSGGGSSQNNSGSQNTPPTPDSSSLGGSIFGPVSPYRGIVSMSHYVSGAGSIDPKNEYIELSVPNGGIPLDLTGWRFMSDATGIIAAIPKGTEVPISGNINASEDIVLPPGTRATIISGRSPIGASFRENKCIGYFSTFQRFYPSLPQNCPLPSDDLIKYYGPNYIRDTACIDYVKTLSRCQVTLTPPPNLSGVCQSFIVKHLNYNGCVETHRDDADFMGNTWRVYLNRTTPMWRTKYEVVKLLDINGKTVDAFSY